MIKLVKFLIMFLCFVILMASCSIIFLLVWDKDVFELVGKFDTTVGKKFNS